MQTASSAKRTWSASASAVEWTATVGDAELAAGADDAQRDLAAVGDEDLLEHELTAYTGSMRNSGWPNSTGLAVLPRGSRPPCRRPRPRSRSSASSPRRCRAPGPSSPPRPRRRRAVVGRGRPVEGAHERRGDDVSGLRLRLGGRAQERRRRPARGRRRLAATGGGGAWKTGARRRGPGRCPRRMTELLAAAVPAQAGHVGGLQHLHERLHLVEGEGSAGRPPSRATGSRVRSTCSVRLVAMRLLLARAGASPRRGSGTCRRGCRS